MFELGLGTPLTSSRRTACRLSLPCNLLCNRMCLADAACWRRSKPQKRDHYSSVINWNRENLILYSPINFHSSNHSFNVMFNIRYLSLKTCQDLLAGRRPPLFHITCHKGFISRFHRLPVSVEEREGKNSSKYLGPEAQKG